MRIYRYHECNKCLVKACCQSVCEGYKQHANEVYGLVIKKDIPLNIMEDLYAEDHDLTQIYIDCWGIK